MTTNSLQSLMSAKVYAEYDRIRKEDGGANPNIVDSSKGRKELGDLLVNVKQSIKSSKADIVLLKAFAKIYDTCISVKDIYPRNSDPLSSLMPHSFSEYQDICQGDGGKDISIVDSAYGYKELQHLLNVAMKEGYPEQDVIMLKALLKVSSVYKPIRVEKNFLDKLINGHYKVVEDNDAMQKECEPIGRKKEKRIPTHKSIRDWMCGGRKKETVTVEHEKSPIADCDGNSKKTDKCPKKKQPAKQKPVSTTKPNNVTTQQTTNNTGINNSFNNNSGIIIIK